MSAWCPAPASPSSASRWSASTRTQRKIAMLEEGRIPIYEPGLDVLVERHRSAGRLSFTTDLAAADRRGRGRVHRRRHALAARRRPCRPDLRLRRRRGDRGVARSTRPWWSPSRPCRSAPAASCSRSSPASAPTCTVDIASNPEFLREGSAIEDFLRPDRVVCGVESERAREVLSRCYRPLEPDRDPDPVHHARDRRADQVRDQRLPRDQDHLHQRGGRPVRARRRRRAAGRQGHGPGRPHRQEVPACRPGLWRLLLPEGHAGAAAHRRAAQHAPAHRRGRGRRQRGQQAPHGAGRSPTPAAARSPARPSPCSASPSSPAPTTCARARRW